MRIIDYYNFLATFLEICLVLTAFCLAKKYRSQGEAAASDFSSVKGSPHSLHILLVLLLIFGGFLRIWNLTGLPDGLQQDEASIGYEAFCLATTGMDRNGFHWPVYPITWGSGGGSPIMIYLNVITTLLFGSGIWSVRIVPAFLGTATLLLFYLLLRKDFGGRTSLAGLLLLTLTPWHIILSRWSLDSNTMPFWQILATLLLVRAALCTEHRTQTIRYLLAAFFFGVCLYSYGSANVVIPLTLLFSCIYLLSRGRITWPQLAGCFAVFLAVCLPLALFYGVNFLGLPEIAADWISFPKFTSSHFGSVFVAFDRTLPSSLWHNVKELVRTLTIGLDGEVSWNAMPGYWTLYCFTWPVTLAGFIVCIRTAKGHVTHCIMLAELAAALLFSLFIQQDINREVLLFLPLVYCMVMGFRWLYLTLRQTVRHIPGKMLATLPVLLLLIGFASFAKDYYGGAYNEVAATDFMPGYGDAMIYADQIACEQEAKGKICTVYSTYDLVASPFMLTLYYTQYDPQVFRDTVVYKDPEAEFRVASSFGHFVYGLPAESDALPSLTEDTYKDDVFVLTKAQLQAMDPDPEEYNIVTFKDRFVVVSRKGTSAADVS